MHFVWLWLFRPHRRCRGMATFEIDPTPKKKLSLWQFGYFACRYSIFQIHRFDPTCSQHGLNMAQQTFNLAQLGSTCPNFDLTWVQHAATWPQVRPVWEQLRPKLSPNMGTWPAPSCETAVSCPMLELTWTYMCIAWLQLGVNWLQLGPIGPTF